MTIAAPSMNRESLRAGLGLLELICREIELTQSQLDEAREHYTAVGNWVGADDSPLARATIYPQGSMALGTSVKPLTGAEYDVDTVCFMPTLGVWIAPRTAYEILGQRLAEHGKYAGMLEPKQRCWRLNYAGRFHMDLALSVADPSSPFDGEMVPDRTLGEWKPTNPRGFAAWFNARAALQPSFLARASAGLKAEMLPLPDFGAEKGVLRRIVQVLKRHRDVYFQTREHVKPISVIVTTLAAHSYERQIAFQHEDAASLITAVVRGMPSFVYGRPGSFFVGNPTGPGENFAEKWNTHPERAEAFFDWIVRAATIPEQLVSQPGIDAVAHRAKEMLGDVAVGGALARFNETVSGARNRQALGIAGVQLAVGAPRGMAIPQNTFFGGSNR